MSKTIKINNRLIGEGHPVYIVAEISANHNQSYEKAVELIKIAKEIGADAVKLQTYTPDTLTIPCNNKYFRIKKGILWSGKTLYELYKKAYMPWEWQPELKKFADKIGITLFSTPFDHSSVDFLEKMNVPAYKIASFELVDLPLIEYIAKTKKPIILSTGMSSKKEIQEAVQTIKRTGNNQIGLLKCCSAYPAKPENMNLKTIEFFKKHFRTVVGLSDHTLSNVVPITALVLGAKIIEKHFTLSRKDAGPDSVFSLEPEEFQKLVQDLRTAEKAIGNISFALDEDEKKSKIFRRSLFIVKDTKKGEPLTVENLRSIRPAFGLPPKLLNKFLGKKLKKDIKAGTPLSADLVY